MSANETPVQFSELNEKTESMEQHARAVRKFLKREQIAFLMPCLWISFYLRSRLGHLYTVISHTKHERPLVKYFSRCYNSQQQEQKPQLLLIVCSNPTGKFFFINLEDLRKLWSTHWQVYLYIRAPWQVHPFWPIGLWDPVGPIGCGEGWSTSEMNVQKLIYRVL